MRMDAGPDITEFLERAADGDSAALNVLMPKVYATLRQLARRQLARENALTLETTALVHEAYLTLAGQSAFAFADRTHFYAYTSRVMRHLLIDRARRKSAHKRQAVVQTMASEEADIIDVLAVDEALNRLAELSPRLARVAELRLFAELSNIEIGGVVGVNTRTVERDWLKARTFLCGCLAPAA